MFIRKIINTNIYIILLMCFGVWHSICKEKNKTYILKLFLFFKIIGSIIGIIYFFSFGPKFLYEKNMLPFLFNKLVIPLSIIIPLGGMLISFLVNFGLLEFIGVLMERIMQGIWKIPGKSSIDAVVSFVGSYSIGLLITNKLYKEGKYSFKESAIIATGFSTVSITFMIIVAKSLNLMSFWNFYFWSSLAITFIVTAITIRIPPLRILPNSYYGVKYEDLKIEGSIMKRAFKSGVYSAEKNKLSLTNLLYKNLKDGILITTGILPSIISIGLLGLILVEYTTVFSYVGYIFYPFTYFLGLENPFLVATAISTGIAEMFLPTILVVESNLLVRYVVGVVCISEILFFSGSIPCILSSEFKIKISHLLFIWIERVILSLILSVIFAKLFLF
ncbi:MAG: YjiH family protein [Fusobacteriaceae bacterium]